MNALKSILSATAASALGLVAVTSLSGCSTEAAPGPMAAPEVQVAAPVVRTVTESRTFPAVLEAVDRVALRAQVSGYLDSIEFQEGALVKKGEVLFRIDPRVYRARLADAQAALTIARAEAQLAQHEAERATRLKERIAISAEEVERRTARAAVAQAQVAAAEAAVQKAALDVEYSTLRAPFAGRIGRSRITRGNLVTPADELGVLVATDQLLVRFDIDDQAFAQLNPQVAPDWRVNFAAQGASDVKSGPVTIVDSEVKAGTGTVRIHARIDNRDRSLLPGMLGQAELVFGERQNALLIDDKAVGANQGRRFVLVVNDSNVLEYRPVTLGARHGQMHEVSGGLTASDRIVINGLMRVRPGAAVTPVIAEMPAVASAALPSRAART
jgi:membrane fusion protein, multidrug efflux system